MERGEHEGSPAPCNRSGKIVAAVVASRTARASAVEAADGAQRQALAPLWLTLAAVIRVADSQPREVTRLGCVHVGECSGAADDRAGCADCRVAASAMMAFSVMPAAEPAVNGRVGSGAGAGTIEGALILAYRNNPQLNAQRSSARATDENVPTALAGYRPGSPAHRA